MNLSGTDRQALFLREEFVSRHPNTAATPKVQKKIERDQILLEKTLAARRLRAAEAALDGKSPALAAHHLIDYTFRTSQAASLAPAFTKESISSSP